MFLVAFDPGETTGIAHFAQGKFLETGHVARSFVIYESKGLVGMFNLLCEFIKRDDVEVVIVEQFRLYSHKARDKAWSALPEVRVQGAIECMIHQMTIKNKGLPTLEFQAPSEAKQMVTNRMLMNIGLYRGITDHGRDAVRHILTYCIKRGIHRGLYQTKR